LFSSGFSSTRGRSRDIEFRFRLLEVSSVRRASGIHRNRDARAGQLLRVKAVVPASLLRAHLEWPQGARDYSCGGRVRLRIALRVSLSTLLRGVSRSPLSANRQPRRVGRPDGETSAASGNCAFGDRSNARSLHRRRLPPPQRPGRREPDSYRCQNDCTAPGAATFTGEAHTCPPGAPVPPSARSSRRAQPAIGRDQRLANPAATVRWLHPSY
jgi:hypothetical protein